MSVLKVELTGAPVVDNALRPLAVPLRPQQGNAKVAVGDYFLSPAFATIHGDDLHFSLAAGAGAQRENLKGWTNPSDWAEWEIVVDQPGSYDLTVNFSSWLPSGAFVVEVAGQSFEQEVTSTLVGKRRGRETPFAAAFKVVSLGRVQFDQPGRYTLSVKALEISPKGSNMI